jgi:hypothetical protein
VSSTIYSPRACFSAAIYACYGNSSVTTDQSHPAGTWNSNYEAVYHFPSPTGVLNARDSTSNANNASNVGTTATNGNVDGGVGFNGSTYLTVASSTSLDNWTAQTVSVWINPNSTQTQYSRLIEKGANSEWAIVWNSNNATNINGQIGYAAVGNYTGASLAGAWHNVVYTISASYVGSLYVDGTLISQAQGSAPPSKNNVISIGQYGGGGAYYVGSQDEIEIQNIAQSTQWILTEYNNQSSPGTFSTVGNEASNKQ